MKTEEKDRIGELGDEDKHRVAFFNGYTIRSVDNSVAAAEG